MGITIDWKIRSRNAQCEHSGAPFQDEEEFYTCIFEDPESDGFLRKDFSSAAWKQIGRELDPAPFSYWKSVFKVPVVEEKIEPIVDNSAEGMLRRMIEEDDSKTENARFILAVMLERKKILIQTDVKETESRKLLIYEHKSNGDVLIVADPELRLDEIEKVQQEVAEQLELEEKRIPAGGGSDEPAQDSGEKNEEPTEGDRDEAPHSEEPAVPLSS